MSATCSELFMQVAYESHNNLTMNFVLEHNS